MGKIQGEQPTGGVDAVDRALRLLACFTDNDASLSLHELAERTGLYKSTILRLTVSLERAGYLSRLADKAFALGPELMRLGAIYHRSFDLERHVRPILRGLTHETRESASFFRRQGHVRICLFREDTTQDIRDNIREGDVLTLEKGAAGRVLTTFSSLRLDAEKRATLVRQLPFVSLGERDAESAAIAVPVFANREELAGALSISGPRTRFTPERVAAMSSLLLEAGRDLTGVLGGTWSS